MKKNLLLVAAVFFSVLMFAQSKVNLVVFSEDGDPFYTYVNGVRQNDKPETNVKITGISPNISLRIVFENRALPELKQNMSLEPGFEHTARIKKDTKKQVKLKYFGQTPISEEATPGVATVQYHTVENPAPAATQVSNTRLNQTGNTTVTSTTTTTRGNAAASDNVAVNVNMAGVGITMNVNGMDNGTSTQMNTTSSTTVTSSNSSSGHISDNNTVASDPVVAAPALSNGCSGAMAPANFSNMKKSVESKPFSDTKMSTAKVATKNACLSINQVKEICKLFSMDEEKLTYAKYAYDRCVDKANYYQVSEVFAFSNTTEEFNKFLEQ